MGERPAASGPDFREGIGLDEIPASGTLPGRVGDEPVLLSRFGDRLFAVGGVCTHYGGALADGLVDGETVRCPLHHACFSLRNGAALRGPAFDALQAWQVEVDGDRVFVREKAAPAPTSVASPDEAHAVLIVGGGAAGFACAERLRRLGYRGRLTLVSSDRDPPCDRPNLSKDFLAGTAPAEWIPLRDASWYREMEIDLRLETEITAVDIQGRRATTSRGESLPYDRLLIATGSEPVRLRIPGFEREDVHLLRSLADAQALAERARTGARAVMVGSSFIGLEAAAALRAREVEVEIVSLDHVPFERILGTEIGLYFQSLHERHGVHFHLGRTVLGYEGRSVRLDDGSEIDADFVLLGVGVRPRLELAAAAGLELAGGVRVNDRLETSVPGIYAAGDIAAYPDPVSGVPLRIEHWVTSVRQGQIVAENMLGLDRRLDHAPFFWTEQYGVALRYVGHAADWDEVRIEGDVGSGSFVARFFRNGRLCATASVGRDLANLEDEVRLERGNVSTAPDAPAKPGSPIEPIAFES